MIIVSKDTPEYSVELYFITPVFIWNKKSPAFRGGEESTTKININLFSAELTSQQNWFMINLCLVFGLGIKIITKE